MLNMSSFVSETRQLGLVFLGGMASCGPHACSNSIVGATSFLPHPHRIAPVPLCNRSWGPPYLQLPSGDSDATITGSDFLFPKSI